MENIILELRKGEKENIYGVCVRIIMYVFCRMQRKERHAGTYNGA